MTHRESDDDLTQETRAELVSNRRGQALGLKFIIPTSVLAALVAALGFNATAARTTGETVRSDVETRLQLTERSVAATTTEIAVIKSQYAALQEALQRIERKLDAAESRERERDRRR